MDRVIFIYLIIKKGLIETKDKLKSLEKHDWMDA